MSKKSGRYSNDDEDLNLEGGLEAGGDVPGAEAFTGRMIVTPVDSGPEALTSAIKRLSKKTGLSAAQSHVCSTADFEESASMLSVEDFESAHYVRLERLGVVVLNADPEQAAEAGAASATDDGVMVEAEQWNYPLGMESGLALLEDDAGPIEGAPPGDVGGAFAGVSREYLLGARSMLDLLLNRPAGTGPDAAPPGVAACLSDTTAFTWGLQATRADRSALSGRGIKVAVLDTGFDAGHPDFVGRSVTRRSFIPLSEPDHDTDDRHGHGTHCIGTSCGSRAPGTGPRYGIAHEAEIFAGKVLRLKDGRAAGADGWILGGIDWALSQGCQVISMSLGSRAFSPTYPQSYERAAQVGLRLGSLIVAATGNDSSRSVGVIDAVGRPANCPSIAGIAALDRCMRVADFSNGQKFGNGGEVNFAGPGVAVHSSLPMPRRLASWDGTSMATPHAAGIAALISQETGFTGIRLYREMRRRAQRLSSRRDFGNGLVRV